MTSKHIETAALLPCPFCGDTRAYTAEECGRHPNDGYWDIHCRGCNATIKGELTEEMAVREWNTRATLPEPQQFLVTEDGEFNGNMPEEEILEKALDALRSVIGWSTNTGREKFDREDAYDRLKCVKEHAELALKYLTDHAVALERANKRIRELEAQIGASCQ